MIPVLPIVVALTLPALTAGQSTKLQWLPEELFDPLDFPRECGLDTDEPSYVCDPNRILGDDVDSFRWILKDVVVNSTKCPCSNHFCESKRGLGYRIGLAVVRQMTLQKGSDGRINKPEDQAQLFAYKLERDLWQMGDCQEDIIIFYSHNDRVLALFGGSTATEKLTPYYRKLLAYRIGGHLEEGRVVEALNNLIYDIKVVLNCDERFQSVDCGLHELRATAVTSTVPVVALLVSAMVAVSNTLL